MDVTTYKAGVDAAITSKTAPSTISPTDVGTQIKALADLTAGEINNVRPKFASVALALAGIKNTTGTDGKNNRDGKIVEIGSLGSYVTYWWFGGFDDSNLVPYLSNLATKADIANAMSSVGNAQLGVAPDGKILTYNVTYAGTYPLYGGLTVDQSELDTKVVQFRYIDGNWIKYAVALPPITVSFPIFSNDPIFQI